MKKIKIRLTEAAHIGGYEGAFFRFTTEDGKPAATGIHNNWYEANGVDTAGNEYRIVWEISDREAFANGDEDCCDWDNPAEVYSYTDGKPVEAVIE